MIKNLFLFIWLTLLCLTSYGQKTPSWVSQTPIDSKYYVGIGSCPIRSDNYIECAKIKALEAIATSISITISSETQINTREVGGLYEQAFYSNILAQTKKNLRGYELVDTWQNNNLFWAYYRLNKEDYNSWVFKQMATNINSSEQYFEKGISNEKEEDYSNAIGNYLLAIHWSASNLLNQHPVYTPQSQKLLNSALTSLKGILANITLKFKDVKLNPCYGKSQELPILIEALYKKTDGASILVKNLPIVFSNTLNRFSLSDTLIWTSFNGIGSVKLNKLLKSDPLQKLDAILSVKSLLPANQEAEILIPHFLPYGLIPKQSISLNVNRAKVKIDGAEELLGEALTQPIIAPYLNHFFSSNGIDVTENSSLADYTLKYWAKTRKGNTISGLYFSFLDLQIELYNQNQVLTYSKPINNVKGGKLNYNDAAIDAYMKAIELLVRDIFPNIKRLTIE